LNAFFNTYTVAIGIADTVTSVSSEAVDSAYELASNCYDLSLFHCFCSKRAIVLCDTLNSIVALIVLREVLCPLLHGTPVHCTVP